MKKNLLALAFGGLVFAACSQPTETTETSQTTTETTIVEETGTSDSLAAEIDNTTVEIEEATERVDSLINQL